VGISDRVAGDCDVCSSVAGIDGSNGTTDVNVVVVMVLHQWSRGVMRLDSVNILDHQCTVFAY